MQISWSQSANGKAALSICCSGCTWGGLGLTQKLQLNLKKTNQFWVFMADGSLLTMPTTIWRTFGDTPTFSPTLWTWLSGLRTPMNRSHHNPQWRQLNNLMLCVVTCSLACKFDNWEMVRWTVFDRSQLSLVCCTQRKRCTSTAPFGLHMLHMCEMWASSRRPAIDQLTSCDHGILEWDARSLIALKGVRWMYDSHLDSTTKVKMLKQRWLPCNIALDSSKLPN